jgi:hypothetical protein
MYRGRKGSKGELIRDWQAFEMRLKGIIAEFHRVRLTRGGDGSIATSVAKAASDSGESEDRAEVGKGGVEDTAPPEQPPAQPACPIGILHITAGPRPTRVRGMAGLVQMLSTNGRNRPN